MNENWIEREGLKPARVGAGRCPAARRGVRKRRARVKEECHVESRKSEVGSRKSEYPGLIINAFFISILV